MPPPDPVWRGRVTWNGEIHDLSYALPGARVADLLQALAGRFTLPLTRMGLFDDGGREVDPASALADAPGELILRPVFIH